MNFWVSELGCVTYSTKLDLCNIENTAALMKRYTNIERNNKINDPRNHERPVHCVKPSKVPLLEPIRHLSMRDRLKTCHRLTCFLRITDAERNRQGLGIVGQSLVEVQELQRRFFEDIPIRGIVDAAKLIDPFM